MQFEKQTLRMNQKEFKLIQNVIEQFNEIEKENFSQHLTDNEKLIPFLDNTIFKFSCLSYHLLKNRGDRELKFNFLETFASSMTNNSIVIKKLFLEGWHLQCQNIMRVQFEQINIALAILSDVNFFNRFQKTQNLTNEEIPFTPRHNDSKKIIRKHIEKNEGKEFWNGVESLMEYLYEELSRSIHCNFLHITMLSTDKSKDNVYSPGVGGNKNSIKRLIDSVTTMNNYSQIMWTLIKDLTIQNKIFDINDTEFELNFMKTPLIIN